MNKETMSETDIYKEIYGNEVSDSSTTMHYNETIPYPYTE